MSAPPQNAGPEFPQILKLRLMEDACLRAHARQLQAALGSAQAAGRLAKREAGLFHRLLGAVVHPRTERPTPAETARIVSRETEVQQECRAEEPLLQQYTEELNTLIATHLQESMPVFLEYSVARKRLGEWEETVNALQTDLRELLKALGQARNSASSGYNTSKHAIAATAQEQFDKADELVHSVEADVQRANEKARELGGVPEMALPACEEAVKNLPGLDIGAMQKEFDRLTGELEAFDQEQLAHLKDSVVPVAMQHETEARVYLEQYREELRRFSDLQLKPEDMARALPAILARQDREPG